MAIDEKRLAEIEAALRPAREDAPDFRPHHDAHPWIGYADELVAEVRRLQHAQLVARHAMRERACKALEAVAGTAPAVLSLDKAGNAAFSHGWNSAIADATAVIRTLPDEE